jgi:hypothetical protein
LLGNFRIVFVSQIPVVFVQNGCRQPEHIFRKFRGSIKQKFSRWPLTQLYMSVSEKYRALDGKDFKALFFSN